MKKLEIREVGPRDGLQNESIILPTEIKVRYINWLWSAGLRSIEIGSMVRPDRVPQMANSEDVFKALTRDQKKYAVVLVPNLKGLERAHAVGVENISVLTGATETFVKKNIGMSIPQTFNMIKELVDHHPGGFKKSRVYVSVVWGCPYEGKVKLPDVRKIISKLLDLGAQEISLSDTIGVATPKQVEQVLEMALKLASPKHFAVHFHDTWGMGTANVAKSLEMGITKIDSSSGGLGGCPYAPGASGNLATEDLIYLIQQSGYKTSVDLVQLHRASKFILNQLKKEHWPSKTLQALEARTFEKSCYPI